ncbi:Ig-like domain-containing domain [Draconibacterium sp. IB214405]|uniref:Ig-like domain-containing domain n=1 Tax=Draconibacterium sp. IB214405 TaxID=3097352 RepID=UPI002A0C51DE|nr:Ig-like domain-containing domain [Draconibacterium sp. IB214405]MDX8338126.1 Ig-like domain-containing domain [Draconibacterium sp. IB214405]
MQLKGKLPLIFIALLAWVVIISSCANIGMPAGGPRDTVPPVLLETSPEYRALNFTRDNVKLTFSEYLQTDKISEQLVISPPLEKRPTIKTKSKTLIIQFNEELKDSVTYSLDFKNSIVDNNEQNPLENLRFSFSTGPEYDSLRVAGRVINSFNLEPNEDGSLLVLHSNLHDSAVYRVRPDYIAKTDDEGLFMIDNIRAGTYNLFAINDLNNDLMYNEGAEEIAFLDTLVIPEAHFHAEADTLVSGVDSMLVMGHTHFSPEPFYMRYFMEDIFEQYVESSERESRNKCLFLFNESVADTFSVKLIDHEAQNWQQFEYGQKMDSILMWITDTTVSKYDSLYMQLAYTLLDSAGLPYVQNDTVLMHFADPEVKTDKKNKRRDREEEETEEEALEPIPQFNWQNNIATTMELNGVIQLVSPEPVEHFDMSMVKMYLADDTLKNALPIHIQKDSTKYRSYSIRYNWEPQTSYSFEIDSAACVNIFGVTSKAFTKRFNTREEDYYGSLEYVLSNVTMPIIIQILKNKDDEEVLRSQIATENGSVLFNYLTPDKYKVKVIYDANGNGKWDGGSFQDKTQPERVAYVQEVIKLRSNWSEKHEWDLTPDPLFSKNIRDREEEERKRKEEEEKRQKEEEEERNNSMFRPGNSTNGSIQGM